MLLLLPPAPPKPRHSFSTLWCCWRLPDALPNAPRLLAAAARLAASAAIDISWSAVYLPAEQRTYTVWHTHPTVASSVRNQPIDRTVS